MFRRQFGGPPWARRGWGAEWEDGPRFYGPRPDFGQGGPGFGPGFRGFGPRGFGGPRFGPGFGPGFGGPHHHHHHHHHGDWQGHRPSPEQMALRSTAAEVARLFVIAGRSSIDNPEKQTQLRAFLERSRGELSSIIYGDKQNEAPTQETQDPNVEQA